jgi:hypothetical protein
MPDLVERGFIAGRPRCKFIGDITHSRGYRPGDATEIRLAKTSSDTSRGCLAVDAGTQASATDARTKSTMVSNRQPCKRKRKH